MRDTACRKSLMNNQETDKNMCIKHDCTLCSSVVDLMFSQTAVTIRVSRQDWIILNRTNFTPFSQSEVLSRYSVIGLLV